MGERESFVICRPPNPFPSPIEGLFFFCLPFIYEPMGAIQDVIASAVEKKLLTKKKEGRRHTHSSLS